MAPSFFEKIHTAHNLPKPLPGVAEIDHFLLDLLQFLFPELNNIRFRSQLEIETQHALLQLHFERLLLKTESCKRSGVHDLCQAFFQDLEAVYDRCLEDAEAILAGDPAAVDRQEVIRAYPGFFAIAVYRVPPPDE